MVINLELNQFFKLVSGDTVEAKMLKLTFISNNLMLGSKVKVKATPDSGAPFTALCFISNITDEAPSDTTGHFTLFLNFIKYSEG